MKREFVAEYVHGMGHNVFIVYAVSATDVSRRYPLFSVYELADWPSLTGDRLEWYRAFPGAGRDRDAAVRGRSEADRRGFLDFQTSVWNEALRRRREGGFPGTTLEDIASTQYWVDIDDDADFQWKMHELWKDDPRYRELPPEKRLF